MQADTSYWCVARRNTCHFRTGYSTVSSDFICWCIQPTSKQSYQRLHESCAQGVLCFFSTPNRFSLGPEPCVRLWGVGFLPRLLAEGYVRSVKGISYRNIHLLSYFQLRRLLSRSGLRHWMISPARITECEQKLLSRFGQALITVYHALRNLPFCSYLLRIVGPFLQISGRR
jgi:hypothetical protein